MRVVPPCPPLDSGFRRSDEVGWWPAGGGLPCPAQGAHKGHPYRCFGKGWDAGGRYGAGRLTLGGEEIQR